MKKLNHLKYQILETLDAVTCGTCGPMDGQVFKMSEFDTGATAPPFHPNCRGTTVPYFDDAGGERIARDAEGNHYSVPGDMTYEEWRKKNEENASKVLTNDAESSKLDNMSLLNMANNQSRRNELPLTEEQYAEARDYAVSLGMPRDMIRYVDSVETSYGGFLDVLYVGSDVVPGDMTSRNPNERLSIRAAIAHEIVGHRETVLAGQAFTARSPEDEAQASLRAAKLAPNLTDKERSDLARDGMMRLRSAGINFKDVKHKFSLTGRFEK